MLKKEKSTSTPNNLYNFTVVRLFFYKDRTVGAYKHPKGLQSVGYPFICGADSFLPPGVKAKRPL